MIKGSIHQEDVMIINICVSTFELPNIWRKHWELKREIDSNTIIIEDFNTSISVMDRRTRGKIKETEDLNTTIEQVDLTDCWAAPRRPTKSCSCPSSRLKKQPRDCDRDINSLLDKGILHRGSWSDNPLCAADCRQNVVAVFTTQGRRRLPFIGGIDIRLAHRLPGAN